MDAAPRPSFLARFGDYEVDFEAGELRKHGLRVKLQYQPFRILTLLVEHPGRLVSRDELQKLLWPNDTIVEFEHSINAAINRLREALNDSADEPRYIETLPRRGYRFIFPIAPVSSPAAAEAGTPPRQPAPDAEMTGEMVGRFRVLEKLGSGGMGVVYRAEDTQLGREVAIKFLPAELASERRALERFQREARAASALDHPNICTVHDIGEHAGRPFIVMPLLKGQTLRQRLSAAAIGVYPDAGRDRRTSADECNSPLRLNEILGLAAQIADALATAHAKGIIHRDIKPGNVFITESGQVKVLDFGLAKLVHQREESVSPERPDAEPVAATASTQDSITRTGVAVGTPAYMSPEQVRKEELDTRTDLFSFGAVLYEMATGRQPFAGDSVAEMEEAIATQIPTPIAELNSSLPTKLGEVIRKALEKNRDQRYQSAADIRADLAAVAALLVPAQRRRQAAPLRRRLALAAGLGVTTLAVLVALNVAGLRDRIVGVDLMPARGRHQAASLPKIESIAVLPLENLSGDKEQEYFSDGMTEELITSLGKVRALRVISRQSVMRYKGSKKPLPEIARELNVDAIVEGTVQRSGNRVRITANLLHASTDRHLWAEKYERDLGDVLALQGEVAQRIIEEIKIGLSPQERTRLQASRPIKPEAFDAYLRGQYFTHRLTREGMTKGIAYFNQAIAADPAYAPAYSGLAYTYAWGGIGFLELSQREIYARAKEAATRALKFDETLADAHAALGLVLTWHDWNWQEAEEEFRRALELSPNLFIAHESYGHYLIVMGRFDEALLEIKRAQQLDPLSPAINTEVGWVLEYSRQFEKAIQQWRKALELEPNFPIAHYNICADLTKLGQYEEAIAECQKALAADKENPFFLGILGYAYAVGGKRQKALQILADLQSRAKSEHIPANFFACLYIGLGEKDEAIEALEKGFNERDSSLVLSKTDPFLDPLRSDRRFQNLVRRMNFPP